MLMGAKLTALSWQKTRKHSAAPSGVVARMPRCFISDSGAQMVNQTVKV